MYLIDRIFLSDSYGDTKTGRKVNIVISKEDFQILLKISRHKFVIDNRAEYEEKEYFDHNYKVNTKAMNTLWIDCYSISGFNCVKFVGIRYTFHLRFKELSNET
jgi:hypothetical protein